MIMRNKIFYIIAGANGSGKTSFAKSYAMLNNLHFINADEIAKKYDPNDLQKYKVKAGKEFFKQLKEYIDVRNESFIIETTLSGKYLEAVIKKAKKQKFKVVLIYLFLESANENIYRVKHRVLNGGHHVPEVDIIRRYERGKKLFWNLYKDIVDDWLLFFNGDDSYELVAENNDIINGVLFEVFKKDIE